MEIFESYNVGEHCYLVNVNFSRKESLNACLDELKSLVFSADLVSVGESVISRKYPDPKFFVGRGKLDELKVDVCSCEANLVIFNHALSPSQERNLEEVLECKVITRTRLILEIFSIRAQTHEGALQVELARLNYASTRLVKSWTHLERQKGGIGVRGGPGETQLELDRRMVRDRISLVESRLERVSKQRALGRNSRKRSNIPTVAIVGYTNAGKSTLFNQLTGADVMVKDQLFATLDPTLRKVHIPRLGDVVFSDTVGFIRNLPHSLVEAFCSTLEEAVEADLLLHVIDVSDVNYLEYMEQVNIVLSQIGADNKPIINVFNKIDLVEGLNAVAKKVRVDSSKDIYLSVRENDGISLLKEEVAHFFHDVWVRGKLHLRVDQGKIRAELYELEVISSEEILEDGSFLLEVIMSQIDLERICVDNTLDINEVFSQQ